MRHGVGPRRRHLAAGAGVGGAFGDPVSLHLRAVVVPSVGRRVSRARALLPQGGGPPRPAPRACTVPGLDRCPRRASPQGAGPRGPAVVVPAVRAPHHARGRERSRMTAPIRVLMITSDWPDHASWGGTATFISRQGDFLRAPGVDVDVFRVRGLGNPLRYAAAWLRVRRPLAHQRYSVAPA